MLIEALVAILIFSIGILGVVGLQATSVQQSNEARNRVLAAQLADRLLGQMWVGDRSAANLQTQYNTCSSSACPGYQAWFASVASTLPGVTSAAGIRPEVTVENDGRVTVVIYWRSPWESTSADPHEYDVQAQIVP